MLNLFNEVDFKSIKTEGIKYIGSKEKIIPYILKLVYKLNPRVVFDGFSGTTRVSQAFAKMGWIVISNDLAIWSKVFANCYLLNKKPKEYYQKILDYLNNLEGKYGWFSKHYGGYPNEVAKKPWQVHNTMKLDAIREEIDKITNDEIEKSVLLTSLILALDKVDNTIGHFSSYLRNWSKRSFNVMKLEVPNFIITDKEHKVYNDDIFKILDIVEADVAYYDPPYGSANNKMPPSRVRYQAYYHIWTTIIKNDKPKLFGKALRRLDSSDKIAYSPFEDFRQENVLKAIENLIKKTKAEYIVFSYSNNGRVKIKDLIELFSDYCSILEIQKIDYKRNVMAYMRWTYEWVNDIEKNIEFLFLLKK
ncbi:MAG: DNA adenine methylase [Minisyncoccia bacterium]|jgi:adenine-specific DNA-methyltransferase